MEEFQGKVPAGPGVLDAMPEAMVMVEVGEALATGEREAMLACALELEEYNLGVCPMMAP